MPIDQLAARQLPTPPTRLEATAVVELLAELPGWRIEDGMLRRAFELADYASGVALVVDIGGLADEMNHHPELHLRWGQLAVSVSTHDVDGLSELDFILAARVEQAVAAAAPLAEPPQRGG